MVKTHVPSIDDLANESVCQEIKRNRRKISAKRTYDWLRASALSLQPCFALRERDSIRHEPALEFRIDEGGILVTWN